MRGQVELIRQHAVLLLVIIIVVMLIAILFNYMGSHGIAIPNFPKLW